MKPPVVSYARSGDVAVAYQVLGHGPPDIVGDQDVCSPYSDAHPIGRSTNEGARVDLGTATAQTFSPHEGTSFLVLGPEAGGAVLHLREVRALGRQPHAPRAEPFSLVFVGPPEPRLEQRIYELEHDALGAFELFLVPIGFDPAGGLRYEAVFN